MITPPIKIMNRKRFISIILFSFCLVACGSDDNDDNETANYSTAILGSWQYQGSKDV